MTPEGRSQLETNDFVELGYLWTGTGYLGKNYYNITQSRINLARLARGANYGVSFFGEDNLRYYMVKNPTLGGKGDQVFHMSVEDSALCRNAHDAARYTGMARSVESAYVNQGELYGIAFPRDGMRIRVPTIKDARGWPHFLEGGKTAVLLEGENTGYLLNPVNEYIIPGGSQIPAGSILFKIGPNGEWIQVKEF